MKGGEAYNVIPESVAFGGTLRSMTNEGLSYLKKRIKEVNSSSLPKLHSFSFFY
jgi:IAA-amino acid hydrolase